MWYVARDTSGAIVGVFRNPQPQADGSCLTDPQPLPEDSQEVADFFNRLPIPLSVKKN